jgi:hypothetical protein
LNTVSDLPNEIFRKWQHSFEEDADGVTVYRPTEYSFPRARGRAGIEFGPEGKFTEWMIGPADAQRGVPGQWTVEAPVGIRISFPQPNAAARTLEIVHLDQGVLKVRLRTTP